MATHRSIRKLGVSLAALACPSCRCSSSALRTSLAREAPYATSSTRFSIDSQRLLHASAVRCRDEAYDIPPHVRTDKDDEQQSQKAEGPKNGLPRNERITSSRIRLVDPETNELIAGVFETRQLLESIDRNRFSLIQVAAGSSPKKKAKEAQDVESGNDQESPKDESDKFAASVVTLDDLPICKLMNIRDEYAKERAAKKALQTDDGGRINRSDAKLHKEVILTWHATLHDRQHKLQPLRSNMMKRGAGSTCKVIVSTKKGNRNHLSLEQKQKMLQDIEDYLCDWSEASQVASGSVDAEPQEGNTVTAPTALAYMVKRRGEVEWRKERQATLTVEVVRR